jgi:CHAT domain-containing protein
MKQLPPMALIRCSFDVQEVFDAFGGNKYPAYVADYSELAAAVAISSNNAEAAAEMFGQTAATYWTVNRFPEAMQFFNKFAVFADPFTTVNPYDSKEDIIRESLLFKDLHRRFVRFMYNAHALPQYKTLCEQNNCLGRAWDMTEKIKSRLLRTEILRSKLQELRPAEQSQAKQLLQQLKELKLKRNYAASARGVAPGASSYDGEIAGVESRLTALIPNYRELAIEVASISQISNTLSADETLLSFFYTDNDRSVYAWKIERNAPPALIKLPVTTIVLYAAIANLKHALELGATLESMRGFLQGFYDHVVAKLNLQPNRRLIIAADQNLSSLPLDIIPWPGGGTMLDAFDFIYVPSATVFYYLRKRNQNTTAGGPYKIDYAGFSYPSEGKGKLTYANVEVRNAADAFPDRGVSKTDAKESDLYRNAEQIASSRYLHFVAHNSEVEGVDGSFYLVFGAGDGEDGRVTSSEIITKLKNRAELVILSACETAIADDKFTPGTPIWVNPGDPESFGVVSGCICSYGESFSNLSGSFFAAGSRQLLLTQWLIRDEEATPEFITRFVAQLKLEKSPAEALRITKKAMRKDLPVYWAGFVLAGG